MFGGGVEIYDALFAIAGDDGVADLPEHFAAEAVRFGVQALEGIYCGPAPLSTTSASTSPQRIARSMSSVSASRACRSAFSARSGDVESDFMAMADQRCLAAAS